ncbi:MAG: SDR family oxidoreductase [Candidatus Thorarchaeota archaeon]
MEDMSGKVCVITGSNSGIGKETAKALAMMNAHVVMVSRSTEKGEVARKEIIEATGNQKVDLLIADLSLMQEVKHLASEVKSRYEKIDVLVNNAGGVNQHRMVTEEGNEVTLAVNHLAPFLLTHELLTLLKCSDSPRIVNVSSSAHQMGKINLEDFQNERYGSFRSYGAAKLLNVMFTYEMARRLENTSITINVLHPGFVNTQFGKTNATRGRKAIMKLASSLAMSPARGAETSIFLASSPQVRGISGKYYADSKEKKSSKASNDENLQREIWTKTEEVLGIDSWSYLRIFDEIECGTKGGNHS